MLMPGERSRQLLGPWVLLASSLWQATPAVAAGFADPSLAAAVAEAACATVVSLTEADQLSLTQLLARERGIIDLAGIEQLANLQLLDLAGNHIRDLTPLSALTHLVYLDLEENQVTDLTPLAALAELDLLILNANEIQDISPLLELEQLTSVELWGNPLDPGTAPDQVAALQSRGVAVLWSEMPTAPDSILWEFLGPKAKESRAVFVNDVVISPADPQLVYASTVGAIRTSRDGGESWEEQALLSDRILCVFPDPQDSQITCVSYSEGAFTSEDLVDLRTTDGGASWDTLSISQAGNLIASDAVLAGRLYALHVERDSARHLNQGTLLVSDDHGDSWRRTVTGEGKHIWPVSVWSHPASPQEVYCGFGRGPVPGFDWFRSEDGARTFVPHELAGEMIGIAPDPSTSGGLYGVNRLGFWHSTDAGQSWVQRGDAPRRNLDRLVVHPRMADHIWAWSWNGGSDQLWHSSDGARTWVDRGMAGEVVVAAVLHPEDTERAFLQSRRGVFRTANAGVTWQRMSFETTDVEVWFLSLDAEGLIYAACVQDPVLRMLSPAADTWLDLEYPDEGRSDLPGLLWANPRHSGVVYAFDWRRGWMRSGDYGMSWQQVVMSGRERQGWPRERLAAAPVGDWGCYAVDPADSALYRSTADGMTWSRLAGDVGAFALDQGTPGRVVVSRATDHAIQWTDDGGATWQTVGAPPSGENVLHLAIHPLRPERVYVACTDGLYAVTLGDGTWHPLLMGHEERTRWWVQICFDPGDPDDLCVLREEGLWQSGDGGRTRESLIDAPGSPTDIHDLAMDPRDPRTVYVGTATGVYRLQRPRVTTAVVKRGSGRCPWPPSCSRTTRIPSTRRR